MGASLRAWGEVLSDVGDGAVAVTVELQPGASSAGVVGLNEWRGRLQVRVKSPAQRGAANDELLALMAHTLGVGCPQVSLVSGAHDRRKRLLINGITLDEVRNALEASMEE